jgi:hypothetical protein
MLASSYTSKGLQECSHPKFQPQSTGRLFCYSTGFICVRFRRGGDGIATGWTAGGFSQLHSVQTGSGGHPISYLMGTGGSFPGINRPGRETDHSPLSSAKV